MLEEVKKGKSWGSCQGVLINRNIKPDELAAWIEEKSVEWLENKDNYQQLCQYLAELGNIASGKLGNIATKLSSELGNFQQNNLENTELISLNPKLENFEQQLTSILEDREYNTYLAWTNEVRENKIKQLETLINQPQQRNDNKSELYREMGRLYAANNNFDKALESFDAAIECHPKNSKVWFNRGSALDQLLRFKEAIASFDKALEIKADDYPG